MVLGKIVVGRNARDLKAFGDKGGREQQNVE